VVSVSACVNKNFIPLRFRTCPSLCLMANETCKQAAHLLVTLMRTHGPKMVAERPRYQSVHIAECRRTDQQSNRANNPYPRTQVSGGMGAPRQESEMKATSIKPLGIPSETTEMDGTVWPDGCNATRVGRYRQKFIPLRRLLTYKSSRN